MEFSRKSPSVPPVEDIGHPGGGGVGIKNIHGYPGGVKKYRRISRGSMTQKRDILNGGKGFFMEKPIRYGYDIDS